MHTYATTSPREFNLFILALADMMATDESDQFSYYEIAGIHGAPFKAWGDGEVAKDASAVMGYCTHSSALFATWHRPYLALLEQRVVVHAQRLAALFTSDQEAWKAAAERVRFP